MAYHNYLPKAPPPNTITLVIWASTFEFCVEKEHNIQSMAERHLTSVVIFPCFRSNHEKAPDKSKLKDILLNICPVLFKTLKTVKSKKD